jgi:hypothetical protein
MRLNGELTDLEKAHFMFSVLLIAFGTAIWILGIITELISHNITVFVVIKCVALAVICSSQVWLIMAFSKNGIELKEINYDNTTY